MNDGQGMMLWHGMRCLVRHSFHTSPVPGSDELVRGVEAEVTALAVILPDEAADFYEPRRQAK